MLPAQHIKISTRYYNYTVRRAKFKSCSTEYHYTKRQYTLKIKRVLYTLIFAAAALLTIPAGCAKTTQADPAAQTGSPSAQAVQSAEPAPQQSAITQTPQTAQAEGTVTFTDAKGREVTVKKGARAGIASGSFADCWILAGGTPAAVTQDAFEENRLDLPEDIIDMGSLENPSAETILNSGLDLVILNATLKGHAALGETLDKAGVPYAYVDIETFDDYLDTLNTFTQITGKPELYEQNGTRIAGEIDSVISANKLDPAPKVLALRASGTKITARDSDTMVGQMLKNLGAINIADSDKSLLKDLSLEAVAKENPEYIFIICRGDVEEAKAKVESLLMKNPIWDKLDAVKNGRVFYLEKELFHYKPNARWAESYEALADIFKQG